MVSDPVLFLFLLLLRIRAKLIVSLSYLFGIFSGYFLELELPGSYHHSRALFAHSETLGWYHFDCAVGLTLDQLINLQTASTRAFFSAGTYQNFCFHLLSRFLSFESDKGSSLYLTKQAFDDIKSQFDGLDKGIIIPRMATVAAVLKETMPHYLWCGFY